jgi:hypothetical protein
MDGGSRSGVGTYAEKKDEMIISLYDNHGAPGQLCVANVLHFGHEITYKAKTLAGLAKQLDEYADSFNSAKFFELGGPEMTTRQIDAFMKLVPSKKQNSLTATKRLPS